MIYVGTGSKTVIERCYVNMTYVCSKHLHCILPVRALPSIHGSKKHALSCVSRARDCSVQAFLTSAVLHRNFVFLIDLERELETSK